jgi:hypothetical protein
MGGSRWLFHFLLVSVLLHVVRSLESQACHPPDLRALLDFSGGWDSKAAGLVGWGPGAAAAAWCSWTGIACDLGRVVALDLSNRSLHGVISPAVASLDGLAALNLSRNALRGPAPEALARLPMLRALDLSANALSSPFPAAGFPAIEDLNISFNSFDGPHPASPPRRTSRRLTSPATTSPAASTRLRSAFRRSRSCASPGTPSPARYPAG